MQDLPRTAPERHRAGRDPRVSDAQPRALSVSVHWMLCPVESCGVARARTRARASRAGPGGAAVLTSPKRSRTCSNPKNRGRHQPGRVRATACAVSDAPVHPAAACAPVSRRIYLVTVFPPGPGGNFQHGAETKSPACMIISMAGGPLRALRCRFAPRCLTGRHRVAFVALQLCARRQRPEIECGHSFAAAEKLGLAARTQRQVTVPATDQPAIAACSAGWVNAAMHNCQS